MNYFIYKMNGGVKPQTGYEHVAMYKTDTETWFLVQTSNDVATIQALTGLEILIVGTDLDTDILAVYPDLVTFKANEMRSTGSLQLSALAGDYFPEERETWSTQKDEAVAYLADNNYPTIMLSSMAAARNISILEMATLVKENMDAFTGVAGAILGKQQKALWDIYTAADLVTAMNVTFPA